MLFIHPNQYDFNEVLQSLPPEKKSLAISYINRLGNVRVMSDNLLEKVEHNVGLFFGLKGDFTRDKSRSRRVVYPRHLVWYILVIDYSITCTYLARSYQVDHTSILHARNAISDLLSYDEKAKQDLEAIRELLKEESKAA
jgi:chromosomal replication initiation ATPase DnaA